MEMPSRDEIAFQFSMSLMKRAFQDLAVSFAAATDGASADEAIKRIEKMVVAEFERMLRSPPDGMTAGELRAALAEAVMPFREMTQEARAVVQQSGKPKN